MNRRKVLITGALREIWKAAAECLLENRFEVVAHPKSRPDLSSAGSIHAFGEDNRDSHFDSLIKCAGINRL